MTDRIQDSPEVLAWERVGSFPRYAEAVQTADDMVVLDGIPRSAVAIWPVGLRVADATRTQAVNQGSAPWMVLGAFLGVALGAAFGIANAVLAIESAPLLVLATLVFVGGTLGTVGGIYAGALASRRPSPAAESEPLFSASQYDLVLDRAAARTRSVGRDHWGAGVVDLRDGLGADSRRR